MSFERWLQVLSGGGSGSGSRNGRATRHRTQSRWRR